METQKRKADGIVHTIAGKVSSPAGYSKKKDLLYLFINFLLSSIIALIRLYRGVENNVYIYRCLVSYKNINIQSTVSLLSLPLTDKEKVFLD
jgi:hypothetical protein